MDGELKKPDGSYYNWRTDSILDGFNSDEMRRMRLSMLEGVRLPECHRCWRSEAAGGGSRRLHTIGRFNELTLDYARSHTDATGATDLKPTFWDARFGNLCNLKCIMCHPESSTQWIKDWSAITGDNTEYIEHDWWKSNNFWEQLEELGSNITNIQLAGGEPLMIERQYDFLQKLVDRGWSKDIELEYDTNLTNVQDRAIEIWKHFKNVITRVSIEDMGDRNRYIRYPSNYDKIIENTLKVKKEVPNSRCFVACTWQVLNAFTVIDLIDDLRSNSIEFSARLLRDPECYDVKILPRHTKLQILEKYYAWEGNRLFIQHLINYIEQNLEYENPKAVTNLIGLNDRLDAVRGTNWRKTFPELWESLNV